MAHRLLVPPVHRMEGRARLPLPQHIGENVTRSWASSMMPADSLRTVKTSQANIATGPLPGVQAFAQTKVGSPNSPESMSSGLRARNAPRVADKTRGQSAGI